MPKHPSSSATTPPSQTVQTSLSDGRQWLDYLHPSDQALKKLIADYHIPEEWIQDATQPEHLPKYEARDGMLFFILRAYDLDVPSQDADTVAELTRKVAVILAPQALITLHRTPLKWLSDLQYRCRDCSREDLFFELLKGAIHSYESPIERALADLEQVEITAFLHAHEMNLRDGYLLKRKASVIRRMLRLTLDLISRWTPSVPSTLQSQLQDFREQVEDLSFYAEELLESSQTLLNLQLSLTSQRLNEASHRTNEVMRVLTIFSVFFLPLNFIAGIYGMNFVHMPELRHPYGYPAILGVMFLVVLSILVWFRSRRWL